jgi:hypothetical protein
MRKEQYSFTPDSSKDEKSQAIRQVPTIQPQKKKKYAI